jgi:hypothetical protein
MRNIHGLTFFIVIVMIFQIFSYYRISHHMLQSKQNFRQYRHKIFRSYSSSDVFDDALTAIQPKPIKKKPRVCRDGIGKPKGYFDAQYTLEYQSKSGLPNLDRHITILGIESSCDDTGVAIIRSDGVILSNVVFSQYNIHKNFGGIVPSLAMEAHKENIEKAVHAALAQANFTSLNEIDAIAVTRGPGLEICLRVGFVKAKVSIHHLLWTNLSIFLIVLV